jgi:hypothetical protein
VLRRKLKLRKEPPRAAVSFVLFYSGIWEPPTAPVQLQGHQIRVRAERAQSIPIPCQLQRP